MGFCSYYHISFLKQEVLEKKKFLDLFFLDYKEIID